jgi:hypothetical protein
VAPLADGLAEVPWGAQNTSYATKRVEKQQILIVKTFEFTIDKLTATISQKSENQRFSSCP